MPGPLHRVAHGPAAATVERLDRLDRLGRLGHPSPHDVGDGLGRHDRFGHPGPHDSGERHNALSGLGRGVGVGGTRFVAAAEGPGWLAIDRLMASSELDAWYRAELDGPARGHRDVAGSLVAQRVAEALADLVVGTLARERRALMPTPSQVALRLGRGPGPGAGLRVEALAVAANLVAVLPDDGDAGLSGTTTVPDVPTLLAAAAEALVELFRPVTRAVRARVPNGLQGMWGTLADHLAEAALRRAGSRPGGQEAAWAMADALVEQVASIQPLLGDRPRPQWVTCAVGTSLFVAKGTCCLVYKAHRPRPGQRLDSRGLVDTGACATCPRRRPDDRRDRLVAVLDRSPSPLAS